MQDLLPVGFIGLMVILGGVSAYVADVLGFKIGKKRISLYRMRPKHVAMVSVTIAGMLIPLITIGLVAALSSDVREWLGRGRTAIVELKEVAAERDRIKDESVRLEREKASLSNKITLGSIELQKQQKELEKQLGEVKAQRAQLAQLEGRLSSVQSRLQGLEKNYQAAKSQVGQATEKLDAQRKQLESERKKLTILQQQRKTLEAQLQRVRKEQELALEDRNTIQSENLRLMNEASDLTRQITEQKSKIDELNKDTERLVSERDIAKRGYDDALGNLQRTQQELDRLRKDRVELETTLGTLRTAVDNSRLNPVLFLRLEEVSRISIPARASMTDAQNLLGTLVRVARINSERRGRTDSPARSNPVIALFRAGNGPATEATFDTAYPLIAGLSQNVVIVANATRNSFQGEDIPLLLNLYPNPVVFEPESVVAESRIDGRRSDFAVYTQITEFLVTRVQDRCRRARLIPQRIGTEETFGVLGPEEILEKVRQIRELNRPVRIEAVVLEETRAGDPLKLELRVRY